MPYGHEAWTPKSLLRHARVARHGRGQRECVRDAGQDGGGRHSGRALAGGVWCRPLYINHHCAEWVRWAAGAVGWQGDRAVGVGHDCARVRRRGDPHHVPLWPSLFPPRAHPSPLSLPLSLLLSPLRPPPLWQRGDVHFPARRRFGRQSDVPPHRSHRRLDACASLGMRTLAILGFRHLDGAV